MILRRVIAHVRKQEWTAIVLDTDLDANNTVVLCNLRDIAQANR